MKTYLPKASVPSNNNILQGTEAAPGLGTVPFYWSVVPFQTAKAFPLTPAGGTYSGSVKPTTTKNEGDYWKDLRYTLDASEPTEASPTTSGSFTFTKSTTVKLKTFQSGLAPSATSTTTYIITP